jgi:hypothetical protein
MLPAHAGVCNESTQPSAFMKHQACPNVEF